MRESGCRAGGRRWWARRQRGVKMSSACGSIDPKPSRHPHQGRLGARLRAGIPPLPLSLSLAHRSTAPACASTPTPAPPRADSSRHLPPAPHQPARISAITTPASFCGTWPGLALRIAKFSLASAGLSSASTGSKTGSTLLPISPEPGARANLTLFLSGSARRPPPSSSTPRKHCTGVAYLLRTRRSAASTRRTLL